MNANFNYVTNLQYKVKALTSQVEAFRSGEKYIVIRSEFQKRLDEKNSKIRELERELSASRRQTVTVRNHWMEVFEDMVEEQAGALRGKDREIKALLERALKAERRVDELMDGRRELLKELYEVKACLEDEQEKNRKLVAQLNRDYENSSIPSSQNPNRKKIANGREKTDKKQGAQPGHKGHHRKKHEPTNLIEIKPPEEYTNNPDFRPTGKIIKKQVVNLIVDVIVDEYWTPEFRHKITRQRVHADFPEGVVNDVNYGGSVKAFAFLLNNHCFVSIDKTKDFLCELTDGKLEISRGMINGLSKEFSKKTQQEQSDAFLDLLRAPVMGVDFTSMRVDGEKAQVLICANPNTAMYYAKKHKGHEGVKDTPAEDYQGALVHDHDVTFYSYGRLHQECLAHILRYLIASIENEPGLEWNKLMRELIREMIHYRNELDADADTDADPDVVRSFESRYLKILEIAKNEYEYEPPGKYNKDGYNLSRRLLEYKDSHLLFLYDNRVPTNNNLCERLLRVLKRKMRQVMTFRSFDSLDYLCTSLGLLALLRNRNENLYTSVASIFA